jgi:hypothetical protein
MWNVCYLIFVSAMICRLGLRRLQRRFSLHSCVSLYDRSPIISSHGASVGFCGTTSEITCAPPLEIGVSFDLGHS